MLGRNVMGRFIFIWVDNSVVYRVDLNKGLVPIGQMATIYGVL